MRGFRCKTLLCCTLLLPMTAAADDGEQPESASSDAPSTQTETVQSLAEFESRWRLSHAALTPNYTDAWPHSSTLFDVDVDSDDSILRVAQIRSLSFLTISGDERSKWFLGINEDGLVGIHFRGFSRSGARRHLDIATLFSSGEDSDDDY